MSTKIMNPNNGFTLIEVAIVMVIIGLALAASIAPLSSQIERSKIAETDAVLNDVMEALYGFAAANGYLPCPASAVSGGTEVFTPAAPARPAAGTGNCTLVANGVATGFIPGVTLNISGQYNTDRLLLDAWGNPIRYSVTAIATGGAAGLMDFTGMNTATQSEMRNVGIANLAPNINICSQFSSIPTGTACSPLNTRLAQNAVAVILSLGKDGSSAIVGNDQLENSGEANLIGGTGITYQIANDRAFVARSYKITSTGTGVYKHQIKWMSPNSLYAKMIAAGTLP